MRKGRDGILRTIDAPHCSECKEPLAIDDALFSAMPASEVSGYVWELPCPACGAMQYVCPVITWQTWITEGRE